MVENRYYLFLFGFFIVAMSIIVLLHWAVSRDTTSLSYRLHTEWNEDITTAWYVEEEVYTIDFRDNTARDIWRNPEYIE